MASGSTRRVLMSIVMDGNLLSVKCMVIDVWIYVSLWILSQDFMCILKLIFLDAIIMVSYCRCLWVAKLGLS